MGGVAALEIQPSHHAHSTQEIRHGAAHRPGRALHRRQGVAARRRRGQQVCALLLQDGDHPRAGRAR
eukprot:430419-Pyramimonas_sp.AAC.1